MAHFYGVLNGSRGKATRCGTKGSGMETYCASWLGAIRCFAWHDKVLGKDMVRVEKVLWKGNGVHKVLYEGEIGSENVIGVLP